MKRREFLTTSTLAGLALATSQSAGAASAPARKQLIELRLYHFASAEQQAAFDRFLAQAAIPALNRAAIKPVGVFSLSKEDNPQLPSDYDHPALFVLLPHGRPRSVASLVGQLAEDTTFTSAGAGVLDAPKNSPAYQRFESSLMLAFDEAPTVDVVAKGPNRRMQLRIYESHNDERALKKIAMFNEGGEIAVFRDCGMPPVFFGQTLIGSKMPNLTYMLAFEDEAAQKAAWDKFGQDPRWIALRNDPAYADTVSNITNLILRPTSSSQI